MTLEGYDRCDLKITLQDLGWRIMPWGEHDYDLAITHYPWQNPTDIASINQPVEDMDNASAILDQRNYQTFEW